jgi:hypothetical protein
MPWVPQRRTLYGLKQQIKMGSQRDSSRNVAAPDISGRPQVQAERLELQRRCELPTPAFAF